MKDMADGGKRTANERDMISIEREPRVADVDDVGMRYGRLDV
jgi:hypothetical protein